MLTLKNQNMEIVKEDNLEFTEAVEVTDLSEETLKAEIEKAKIKRAEECAKEIDAILKKYNCTFITDVQVSLNGVPIKI